MSRSDLNTRTLADVSPVLPADGEGLIFDAAAGMYVPGALADPAGGAITTINPDPLSPPSSDLLTDDGVLVCPSLTTSFGNALNNSYTLGRTYYMPFTCGWACEASGIYVFNAGANAAAVAEIGLYDSDGTNGLPGTRLAVKTGLTMTVVQTLHGGTFTAVPLEAGRVYWLAFVYNGNAVTIRSAARTNVRHLGVDPTAGTNTVYTCMIVANTSLNDPATTPTAYLGEDIPMIYLTISAGAGGGGGGSEFADVNEFDLADLLTLSKELSYDVDGNLEQILLYSDTPPTTLIYTKDFTYDVDGNLEEILLTRDSDSATFTKTLAYDVDGNLESVEIS